jgi:uncharacterized protein YfbU (UPF0304 family)
VQNVYEKGLSADECREVIHTLSMFALLEASYAALADKSGIEENDVKFQGYDGNNETSFMTYVEYLLEEDKFTNLLQGRSLNSHFPARDGYHAMLAKFNEIPAEQRTKLLTKDQLKAVAAAG